MFRKIVSNLSFSPALVGQLGFYAKRLKKEEATRRIGLIFTALALVVQSFAVFIPPESANASSANSFVSGGVTSVSQYLSHYDSNTNNIKDLYSQLGITRAELAAASKQTINSKGVYSWGLQPKFSASQGEGSYSVSIPGGGSRTFYYRPLSLWDTGANVSRGSSYTMFVGQSTKVGWFAFVGDCGNLVMKTKPVTPTCPSGTTGTYPNCQEPPTATCSNLSISGIDSIYTLRGQSVTSNGATVTSYRYVIKKNGQIINTKTVSSSELTNDYYYTQTQQGTYTVELTVVTSLGDKTSSSCIKTFTVPAPQMCALNTNLKKDDALCQPCPGDSTIWIKDSKCIGVVVQTKASTNNTQGGIDATTSVANTSDKVTYLLTVENTGTANTNTSIAEHLSDVLEYSTIIDNGGGVYDSQAKTLSWSGITLAPKQKETRTFTVQVSDGIPAMAQGSDDKDSYNCIMTNTFGNSLNIKVNCPAPKAVEQVVQQLPHTGPTENVLFAGIILAIVTFFYARSRQLKTEVRLVRKNLNTGTI